MVLIFKSEPAEDISLQNDIFLLKTLYNKAYAFYKEGNFRESLNLVNNTSELWIDYPQKFNFLFLIGYNNYKLGNYNSAERALLEALALYPDNIRALIILGKIFYLQERYREAEKIYLHAARYDIYNFNLSLKTAQSAWKSGSPKRMIKRLKEGFLPEFINKKEERQLKLFLLDFLHNSNVPGAYNIIKKFRSWCYNQKNRLKLY